jgi:hypothetical protein
MDKPTHIYHLLGTTAVGFFEKNDFGWIQSPIGGHILGVRAGEDPRPLVASRCMIRGRMSSHSQMRLWTQKAESLENLVGICAFLLFGDYEALFDEFGQPVFLEGVEEAKEAFLPHYREIPEFLEIEAATKNSQTDMEAFMDRVADDRGADDDRDVDGEGWKYED